MGQALGHVVVGAADVAVGTFRQRLSRALAWSTVLLAVLALVLGIVVAVSSGDVRSIFAHQLLLPFSAVGFAVIGGLVAARRPEQVLGWVFLVSGALQAVVAGAGYVMIGELGSSALVDLATWLGLWLWNPATFLPVFFVLLLFPSGRLLAPAWRVSVWAGALGVSLTSAGLALLPGPLETWMTPSNPYGVASLEAPLTAAMNVGSVLLGLAMVSATVALALRYRRSVSVERRQLKWLAYAATLLMSSFVVSGLLTFLLPTSRLANELSIIINNLGVLGIAAAAGIAILYHRLYDIDVVINRTLVYAALTAVVAVLYIAAVGVTGWLVRGEYDAFATVVATGLVAVLFQPLRSRLQRSINRLLYGQRDEPVAVLASLGERLENTTELNAVPLTLVRTIAESLKLPYVAMALAEPTGMQVAAEYGRPVAGTISLPLVYQHQEIGELRVAPRDDRGTLDPADSALLETVVRQAGAALRSVQLTRDLRRSHNELVTLREEERRRLRRDLHDGLGPTLASLTLGLDASRNLLDTQPSAASPLLLDMRDRVQDVIKDVRRLVNDLRPPSLDELGLVGALKEQASQHEKQDLRIEVHGETLPPLPAAVEVAAYRIVQEALTNVVRHAGARTARVALGANEASLHITIEDDGVGLPAPVKPGVGLGSMRERAMELGGQFSLQPREGGGTVVSVTLPLQGGR